MNDHAYISTACYHELHDACRRSCKFCDAPCGCECHDASKPSETPKLAEALRVLTE